MVQPFFPTYPNLPRDVVNHTLSFFAHDELNKIERVSKEWKRIAIEQGAWTIPGAIISNHNIRAMDLLQDIDDHDQRPWTDEIITEIIKECFLADSLDISNTRRKDLSQVTDTTLKTISQGCPLLRHMSITDTSSSGFVSLTEQGLKEFVSRFPRLKSINFMGLNQIIKWQDLLSLLPKLEGINLSSPGIGKEFTDFVLEHFPNLTTLSINKNSVVFNDAFIQKLTSSHAKLNYLRLDNCREITADAIAIIQKNCPKMRKVTLRAVPQEVHDQFNGKKLGSTTIITHATTLIATL